MESTLLQQIQFDITGELLEICDGMYSGIPERCEECGCAQSDPNWKDFTNKTVHVCEQCNTEYYIYC